MSERLRTEVTAYQLCILDDSVVEGPHASVGRAARCSSTSSVAWWSASIRLAQNAALRGSAAVSDRMSLHCFRNWKLLGQRDAIKYNKGVIARVGTKRFIEMLYRTDAESMRDWSSLALVAKEHAKTSAPKPKHQPLHIKDIQRDWFRLVFKEGSVFSWEEESNVHKLDSVCDGTLTADHPHTTLSLVRVISQRMVWKKHVQTGQVTTWRTMAVPAIVQHCGVWQRRPAAGSDTGDVVEVYQEGHPEVVDLMHLASWSVMTNTLTEWAGQRGSDTPGCMALVSPELIKSRRWCECT